MLSISVVSLLAFFYVYAFMSLLEVGKTEGLGFVGIVQSDTISYRKIYLEDNIFIYLDAYVKNTFLPTIIWKIFDANWYLATLFNLGLLLLSAIYIKKIASHLGMRISNKIILLFIFMPETFIYLIGVLKEIPSLFFLTVSTYYFLKRQWILYVLFIVGLILFRYQFVVGISLFLAGQVLFKKNNIKFLVGLFIFISATYPFWVANVPALGFEDAQVYRELEPGLGIGAVIEKLQSDVYVVSFFATLVKFFQMITAPWPTPNVYDGENINVISLAYAISAILMLPIWGKYVHALYIAFRHTKHVREDVLTVLCISFSFLMMVALNSFVHHRYLFPGVGLVILVALAKVVKYSSNQVIKNPVN
jgi:hypothetical protein